MLSNRLLTFAAVLVGGYAVIRMSADRPEEKELHAIYQEIQSRPELQVVLFGRHTQNIVDVAGLVYARPLATTLDGKTRAEEERVKRFFELSQKARAAGYGPVADLLANQAARRG